MVLGICMQEGSTVMHLSLYKEQETCQVAFYPYLLIFLGNIAFFGSAGQSLLLSTAYFCSRLLAESSKSGQLWGECDFSRVFTAPGRNKRINRGILHFFALLVSPFPVGLSFAHTERNRPQPDRQRSFGPGSALHFCRADYCRLPPAG